jgi:Glycosyl transferases group 1
VAFVAEENDYLQDVVFHGLATLLGPPNVVEYPRIPRYHGQPPPNWQPAQHRAEHWFGFSEPPRTTLKELLASADAVVIGSIGPANRSAVEYALTTRPRVPVVYIDGRDSFHVVRIRSLVDVYCKREVVQRGAVSHPREAVRHAHRLLRRRGEQRDPLLDPTSVARAGDRRLIPLPFAWIGDLPPRSHPEYEVAFLGSHNTSRLLTTRQTHLRGLVHEQQRHARLLLVEQLRRLAAEGLRVRILADGERLTRTEYLETLSRTRVGVSVRGSGFDTQRYWEIPACGAALLAEPPQIVIPDNFVGGHEAVFVPVGKMVEMIPSLLETDADRIARAGREALAARHTSVQRAERVCAAIAEAA